ncbi:hypothetical protein DSCOOX_59260 [Desulfosarcina ovata subsp. ovata]|uniref:Uncharacterized protein n=1 Tax=Desulfosarcina ovata subsp. ovata TaxID=2752305 RepID=A0A5K8AJQ0_9BACT|nr:hypothetical protein DSCOOX_59260 [Desulfosarcina ovata subsp. ovata]
MIKPCGEIRQAQRRREKKNGERKKILTSCVKNIYREPLVCNGNALIPITKRKEKSDAPQFNKRKAKNGPECRPDQA